METGSRIEVTRGREKVGRESFNGCRVYIGDNEKVLGTDCSGEYF